MKEIKRYSLEYENFRPMLTGEEPQKLYVGMIPNKYGDWVTWGYHTDEIEQLQARIKELESERHINEIKAQYLEWIIKTIEDKCKAIDPMGIYEPAIDIKTLKGELKKLRTNHD